jgi:hypothetical protein
MTAITMPTLCSSCLLHTGGTACHAFPGGIPVAIRLEGADHRFPMKGDDGLVWQFDPEKPEQYAEWVRYNGGTDRRED